VGSVDVAVAYSRPGLRTRGGLKAGKPVVLASSALLRAFLHAGLPYRSYAFGGREWGKTFVLDEHDQLREWVPE